MKHRRLTSLLVTLMLTFSLCVSVYAASSTTAVVPVTLSVDNEYRAVNVTVPASFPIHVVNGSVLVADCAKITNHSKSGAVQVTAVQVKDGACRVGNYEQFFGSQTIALKINGCPTVSSGELSLKRSAFPIISGGGSLALTYYAKISKDIPNSKDTNAANVIFTISAAESGGDK